MTSIYRLKFKGISSSPANTLYTILGIIGVAALVGFGYFKRVRK